MLRRRMLSVSIFFPVMKGSRDPVCSTRHGILFTRGVFRNQSVAPLEAKTRYNHVGLFVVLSFVLPTNQGSGLVVDSLHVACETQLLSLLVVSKATIQHDTAMLAYTFFSTSV